MTRLFNILLITFGAAVAGLAQAAPFDSRSFEAAQASGKPVLVEVHADWCPVCAGQKPVIGELLSRPEAGTSRRSPQ